MKVLLVSDDHHFSTREIYDGYTEGLRALGIDFEPFDVSQLHSYYNENITYSLLHSKAMIKVNGFTHIVIIGGSRVPEWLWDSFHSRLKVCVISVDDPHSSMILFKHKHNIDYYFTNEKTMASDDANMYYLPTATRHLMEDVPVDDGYKSDVLFIGTLYPNRVEALIPVVEYCEENKLSLKIIGNALGELPESIVKCFTPAVTTVEEAKKYYNKARITLNIARDINWSPTLNPNSNLFDAGSPAYSLNPGAYEIASSRALQTFLRAREESKELFGDSAYYANDDSETKNILDEVINTTEEIIKEKRQKAFNVIMGEHTYVHRARKLIDVLEKEK